MVFYYPLSVCFEIQTLDVCDVFVYRGEALGSAVRVSNLHCSLAPKKAAPGVRL